MGASEGIDTFTWYNATMPGVKPLKNGGAGLPPMDTVGVALV